jgi:hypothetical protein
MTLHSMTIAEYRDTGSNQGKPARSNPNIIAILPGDAGSEPRTCLDSPKNEQVALLCIAHATEADAAGAVVTGCHQQQLAVLVIAKCLREIPD